MAEFRYRALGLDGKEVQGVISGEGARQVRGQLRERALFVVDVEPAQGSGKGWLARPAKLGRSELTVLTRQWSTLLEAGISLEKALAALIEQNAESRTRQVLAAVREELLAGQPLHKALAVAPHSFDALYRALIAAGEASGQLAPIMARLADYLEHRGALGQRVVQALVYPVLVVLVALAVVLLLMTYVVPQVVAVFQSGHQSLPLLTRGLIALSDFLRLSWPLLLLLAFLGGFAGRAAWRVPAGRYRIQQRLMRLPGLGRLLVALDSARLAQTLAILVGSGVPLLGALAAGSAVVWLDPLRQALDAAADEVREGSSLHRALARDGLFPPLLIHMIASGEASGRLGEVLAKAARQQADETGNRIALAMSLFEPLLILLMGGVVLVIVLAILQPIIEINQLLR